MPDEISRLAASIDKMADRFELGLGRVHKRLDEIDNRQQSLELNVVTHTTKENIHHEKPCNDFLEHMKDLDKRWGRAPAWLLLGWTIGGGLLVILFKYIFPILDKTN